MSPEYPILPGSRDIEQITEGAQVGRFRSVLFDFDGTISLIREGWREIMIPMMVDILADLKTRESREELTHVVSSYVDQLTGKQTIYQMIQLCDEIESRGGSPEDPLAYKQRFNDLLMGRIESRVQSLKAGAVSPTDLMLPNTIDLLDNLKSRGLTLYLASGTDVVYVEAEARLLGLSPYFEDRIFGALDRHEDFSKEMVIQDILKTQGIEGRSLLGFGDGYVEIENIKAVGGIAVGVASDETNREGLNAWKRDRLIGVGADFIIPDYREQDLLVSFLFGESL